MSQMNRPTLLWVDDEPNLLKSFKRAFRGTPYEIITVHSGEEALKVLPAQKIQVVVSDYRMPNMNGIELLEAVEKFDSRIVRVILSGYADEASVEQALKTGKVWRYLLKPIDNSELLKQVEQMFKFYSESAQNGTLKSPH